VRSPRGDCGLQVGRKIVCGKQSPNPVLVSTESMQDGGFHQELLGCVFGENAEPRMQNAKTGGGGM